MDPRKRLLPVSSMVPLEEGMEENQRFIFMAVQYILTMHVPRPEVRNSIMIDLISPLISKANTISRKFSKIQARIQDIIKTHLGRVLEKIRAQESSLTMLRRYGAEWRMFKISESTFETGLLRIWLPSSMNKPCHSNDQRESKLRIKEICYQLWIDTVLKPCAETIKRSILILIENYRDSCLDPACASSSSSSSSEDISTIKAIASSYKELECVNYNAEWEELFLADTHAYYKNLCAKYIQSESVPSYLAFCNKVLDLEEQISALFLTKLDVISKHSRSIDETILVDHKDRMRDAIIEYIKEDRTEELHSIYRIFTRIKELQEVRNIYVSHTEESLASVFAGLLPEYHLAETDPVKKQEFPALYCKSFIAVAKRLSSIIHVSFEDDQRFISSLERVQRKTLNDNAINVPGDLQELSARFVALFANSVLTDPVDNDVTVVRDLFVLLASKDVFCKNYRNMLMTRLLRGRSRGLDIEAKALDVLRKTHDMQLSNEIAVMLRDIESSRAKYGADSGFCSSVCVNTGGGIMTLTRNDPSIAIDPLVLTMGSWPIDSADHLSSMKLPGELERLGEAFQTKFSKLNNERVVEWIHDVSTAIIELKTEDPGAPAKTYRITMNHLQVAAIMAVHANKVMTTDQICVALDVPINWLLKTLESLSACHIFQQNPKTKQWRINPNFRATSLNLNASLKFVRPTVELAVDPQIEEDRDLSTQAAVVRVMKSRRRLDHTSLCDDVMRQTSRFFPQKIDRIKRAIEKLINGTEKYLDRVDARTYVYMTGTDV